MLIKRFQELELAEEEESDPHSLKISSNKHTSGLGDILDENLEEMENQISKHSPMGIEGPTHENRIETENNA
jgi:hypothetical protein